MKIFSALLREKTFKHDGGYYCLNYVFRTENKFKAHENMCKSHDYCYIELPENGKSILRYNHGGKSMKVSFVIYDDTESLLEKKYKYKTLSRKVINH